jgi:hypothetical protein
MRSNPLTYLLSIYAWFFVVFFAIIGISNDCHLLSGNKYVTVKAFTVPQHFPISQLKLTINAGCRIGSSFALCGSSSSMNSEMDEELAESSLIEQPKSAKKPRPSPTGFSYVEDGVYTNIEIEAMGGDPSFLIESPSSATTSTISASAASTSSDASPAVKWEWDGVEENDAYFDE